MPTGSRSRSGASAASPDPGSGGGGDADGAAAAECQDNGEATEGIADLSFREAQLALELVLQQLQSSELEVEAMVNLHRRGQAYADRCQQLLQQVEQELQLWDPEQPQQPPQPYQG